jgi:dihydrofolate reductase
MESVRTGCQSPPPLAGEGQKGGRPASSKDVVAPPRPSPASGGGGSTRRVPLVLVAAVAENGVIGRAGGMPWRLRTDLKRFRALTTGHPVVMGRKTYLSFGKPLKDRTNIVITADPHFAAAGIVVTPGLENALEVAEGDALRRGAAAIVVGGGAGIYSGTIGMAARLEITRVHVRPEGDTVFPDIDPAQWREIARQDYAAGPDDDAPFTTLTYERRRG